MDGLVTIEKFKKQVWDIEGVKINVRKTDPKYPDRLVRPYNYERLPDDATVDDLRARINKCLEPFVYIVG